LCVVGYWLQVTANGLRIREEGAIEAQTFNFEQMPNRIPNIENGTSSPFFCKYFC